MPGKKLLVADDSLTIQKVIRLALSNEGYEIQAVADGNDAINQILLFRPDVVLIDVSLPGKNAFEVKREVNDHEDLRETRFVLISSAFEKVDERQVEEVEFHGRLTKPFDPAHLRKVLSSVLAQVTAKRMEPTSFLKRPPPLPIEPSGGFDFENSDDAPPPLPLELPPLPGHEYQPDEDEDHPNLPIPPQRKSISLETEREPLDPSHGLTGFPPNLPEDEIVLHPPVIPGEMSFNENDLFTPPPPPEYEMDPPPPPMADSTGETDIQRLTESTMRISRMDDYQWSMNEPSMRPPPLMRDQGNSNFKLNSESEDLSYSSDFTPPPLPLLDDNSSMDLPPLNPPPLDGEEEQVHSTYYSDPDSRSPIIASEEKIDAMIHNQIEVTLEKMIEKLLPQIAEKLIKDEIHRLLSE
ncbi:MAG: response regulator [Bdellovibrionia bacterium]